MAAWVKDGKQWDGLRDGKAAPVQVGVPAPSGR